MDLPNELLNDILSQLDVVADRSTLQAWALTSKSWLTLLRPIIFDTVGIRPMPRYPRPSREAQLAFSHARHIIFRPVHGHTASRAILRTLGMVAPHLSQRFCTLTIPSIHTSLQEWERCAIPSLLHNSLNIRERVTSLLLEGPLYRGIGAVVLSLFPNVNSLQCVNSPSHPNEETLPLTGLALSTPSWDGHIMWIANSLISPPTVSALQSLQISFHTTADRLQAFASILPQLIALIELRLCSQKTLNGSASISESSTLNNLTYRNYST
jgi:hypothetical protein